MEVRALIGNRSRVHGSEVVMQRYEYQFGVYVDAENEQDAWEKVRAISEALDAIDAEGDSAVEGPFPVSLDADA